MEKEPQNRKCSFSVMGCFDEKCSPPENVKNTRFFCTFHIDKTPTQVTVHSYICSKTQVFVSTVADRMVLSAQELFAIEKMATAGMDNKKIAITLGLPLSTTKRWLEGELVSHSVGRRG